MSNNNEPIIRTKECASGPLTPEEKVKIEAISKKWQDIVLSTKPMDKEKAEAAVKQLYQVSGLREPTVYFARSPLEMALMFGALQIGGKAEDDILKYPKKKREEAIKAARGWSSHYQSGAFGASSQPYFEACRDVLGVCEQSVWDTYQPWEDLAKYSTFRIVTEEYAILSDFPVERHTDEEGRLHSLEGPSLQFSDGFAVYAIEGTPVPNVWFEDPNYLTPQRAITEPNMELRAAAFVILGMDRILQELGYKVIDEDEDEFIGQLVEVNLPDVGPSRYIYARCGTGRPAVVGVPNEMESILQAQAWTYGLTVEEFNPENRT